MKKPKVVILGITAFNHDSSASIICDGQLIAFAEEERFNGVKHSGDFPSGAIRYCLSEAGVTASEITDIAFYFNVKDCWKAYFKHNNPLYALVDPSVFKRKRFYYEFIWLLNFQNKVRSLKRLIGSDSAKVHYIDHHNAHTWYGYYSSGFEECVVLSNDSVGESASTLAVHFKRQGSKIATETLIKQHDPHSLGYMYGAVTDYLGFKRGEGEGRVMALASFGKSKYHNYFLDNIELLKKGKFKISRRLLMQRSFQPKGRRLSASFYTKFGAARKGSDEIRQKHYDISSGLQNTLEAVGFHQLDYLAPMSDRIVLVGGVAQNSVFNGKATNRYSDKEFSVPPIPHDAGCSIGAAVYVSYREYGVIPDTVDTARLGPSYSDDYIINALRNNQIKYETLENPEDFTADELAKNKTIACFRGRMECGPRALCNRSILASPHTPEMRDHLNLNVKYREAFRPYGGFMLRRNLDEVLIHKNKYKAGPYMTYVYDIQSNWVDKISSLVHIDNTCRIQIIDESDKFMEKTLLTYRDKTGVPVLINTSLNLRGYPIARTPEDAISTFYTSAIDYLLFNERILVRKVNG